MDSYYIGDRHIIESAGSNSYANTSYDESKMEVVKAFNSELVSLYDIKPPISKAKMTAITKAAMKSVKFYKHVVHGVEKFILKCRPDYKIPGLYVIDSIVRQSRHQFGVEKDVFAPRFSKNLLQTFKNICLCPEEDKQKLVRVINLWQKHKVFPEDLLKKFLVMAESSEEDLSELYKDEIEAIQKSSKKSPSSGKKKKKSPTRPGFDSVTTPVQNSYFTNNTAPRATSTYNDSNKSSVDPSIIQQLQTLTTLLQQSNAPNAASSSPVASVISNSDQVKFDKKLLDYDYGEEEEENGSSSTATITTGQPSDSITSILTNPDILRQLQSLQMHLSMAQHKQQEQPPPSMLEQQRMMMNQPIPVFNPAVMPPQFLPDPNFMNMTAVTVMQNAANQYNTIMNTVDDDLDDKPEIIMEKHGSDPLEVIDLDHIATPPSDRSTRRSFSRSRSRSSSRSPRSRSRRTRSRRSRSRSWGRDRSRDRERNDDRRRRALPPIKRKHLAVCSTTLWVGHLSKLVQTQDLSDTFGQYGDIVSIDLIPPRGCAFLCMNRRQDADRALHKLKNTKIHSKAITIAWAPGKGMKGREWKDYWEVVHGVSYIPWSKLTRDTDFDLLEEGGMLDQETMPDWLKVHLEEKRKISYGQSKALYTPSGTDMDESDNDGDILEMRNTDMIIETTNGGMPEQMIPLPDGPQPNTDLQQPPLGIPMPPGQNPLPPPPSLLNPFNLPPRLLAPVGVLGGNFIPPLGVPPPGLLMSQQSMVNRLPPPFPGPPGLPLLNPGPGPNSSLSQIPLPDSIADTSGPTNEFKPPPFGLTPPLLFPGNPNIKINLPGNPLVLGSGNPDLTNDDLHADKNSFASPFKTLPPFNPASDPNSLGRDFRHEDTDYRIPHPLGDISNANAGLKDAKAALSDPPPLLPPPHPSNNLLGVADNKGPNDPEVMMNFSRDRHLDTEYDRERYAGKFQHDRYRNNLDKDRGGDRFHDRNHRFGGGRSPYREDGLENDRRDAYRRSRFDRDFDRDYRGGRDFRGGGGGGGGGGIRGREPLGGGGGGGGGPNLRFRARSRERERDRDYRDRYRESGGGARRDYAAENENRKRAPYERPPDRYADAADDAHRGGKRTRWGDVSAVVETLEQTDAAAVQLVMNDRNEETNDYGACHDTDANANTSLDDSTAVTTRSSESTNMEISTDETSYNEPESTTPPPAPSLQKERELNQNDFNPPEPTKNEASSELQPALNDKNNDDDDDYAEPESISHQDRVAGACGYDESVSTSRHNSPPPPPPQNEHVSFERSDDSIEIRNERMTLESGDNSLTEFDESARTEFSENTPTVEASIREPVSDEQTTTQAVSVTEAAPVKPAPKKSNTFDMFADDDEEPPPPQPPLIAPALATDAAVADEPPPTTPQSVSWTGGYETTSLPFVNAVPFAESMAAPPASGPFSGIPDFHQSPFAGQPPHLPPFLMQVQVPPQHFPPFAEPRPTRPFMPSRSNNF